MDNVGKRAATGSGDAGKDVPDGGAAEYGVEVNLDSFFVVVDAGGQNVSCDVIALKGYVEKVGELGDMASAPPNQLRQLPSFLLSSLLLRHVVKVLIIPIVSFIRSFSPLPMAFHSLSKVSSSCSSVVLGTPIESAARAGT